MYRLFRGQQHGIRSTPRSCAILSHLDGYGVAERRNETGRPKITVKLDRRNQSAPEHVNPLLVWQRRLRVCKQAAPALAIELRVRGK